MILENKKNIKQFMELLQLQFDTTELQVFFPPTSHRCLWLYLFKPDAGTAGRDAV